MYRIVLGNTILATLNSVVWIKMQNNGTYCLCDEQEAQGIALNNKVYHVDGKPSLIGCETVIVTKINEFSYYIDKVTTEEQQKLETQTALAELSILIATIGEAT